MPRGSLRSIPSVGLLASLRYAATLRKPGCNEIFMQSQRVLAAENAENAKAHAAQSTCLRSLTR